MNPIEWELIPQKSIGGMEFGISKNDVHKILGRKYKRFRKSSLTANDTDAYPGYHVYYNKCGAFEALEIFKGINVTLNGKQIFPGKICEVKANFCDLEYDVSGCISKEFSVGFYVPNEQGKIEAILVAKKGYYD